MSNTVHISIETSGANVLRVIAELLDQQLGVLISVAVNSEEVNLSTNTNGFVAPNDIKTAIRNKYVAERARIAAERLLVNRLNFTMSPTDLE